MTSPIQLAYEDSGAGRPLLLVHGFCGSSAYWKDTTKLLQASYRVIAPDLRGHGRSEAPDVRYTVEMMADDLAALVERLELNKPVLLGHSLGGYVALAFAEKYPELLAGYGLIHSTARPDDEQGKANRNKAIETIKEKGIESFIDGLIPKLFAPDHLETMQEHVQASIDIGYITKPEGAIHTAEAMRDRPDRNKVLRDASLPVLLVAGGKDQIIPAEKTFSVQAAHITQARIDQAGHMSMMEAPDVLANIITQFVSSRC
ncbi:MAG: alpha/beta hydrolase [Paenibacillus sp.]|nr:alpha/beta hydrolase [Paenibacillus sp.]